jgi:hypothetical protein
LVDFGVAKRSSFSLVAVAPAERDGFVRGVRFLLTTVARSLNQEIFFSYKKMKTEFTFIILIIVLSAGDSSFEVVDIVLFGSLSLTGGFG